MLHLRIPREDLLWLARELIARYEYGDVQGPFHPEIALFGEMARDPSDDLEHPE